MLLFSRMRAHATLISLLLTVSLIFTGCTGSQESSDGSPPPSSYTGTELFEGLVLAQGDVAQRIPPIQKHWMAQNYVKEDDQLDRLQEFTSKIVEQVSETNPDFLSNFKTDVTSGDRNRIQNALNRGAIVAANATASMDEVQDVRRQLRENPDQRDKLIKQFRDSRGVRDTSVTQFEGALERFVSSESPSDAIPKPINVDYAAICYVHVHVSVWNVKNYFRDFAVVVDVNLDRQFVLPPRPQVPVRDDPDRNRRLLHEETIDSIARNLET